MGFERPIREDTKNSAEEPLDAQTEAQVPKSVRWGEVLIQRFLKPKKHEDKQLYKLIGWKMLEAEKGYRWKGIEYIYIYQIFFIYLHGI